MLDVITKRSGQIRALYLAILYKIRQAGTVGFLRFCAEKLHSWYENRQTRDQLKNAFDLEFGTDTADVVPLWKLNIDSPHRQQGHRYQASDPDVVRAAIEKLPIRPEEFVFVDIGSGKGLTLLLASEYPFRRVIGVEFSVELTGVAVENIRRYRNPKRQCDNVSAVCADAANYEFPAENLLLYLYNPFGEEVLQRMLTNLRSSFGQNRRKIYLVYINIKPESARLLDGADFLERIEVAIEIPSKTVAVYRCLARNQ